MSMPDCLVVQPIAESAMARLEAAGLKVHVAADTDFATLRPYLAQARAVITRNHGLSEREIEAAPHLRVVGVHGTGTDRVAKQALAARDIPLFNTPGANARSVAELTVALMFACARRLREADAAAHARRYDFRLTERTFDLGGRRLGLVGFGQISQLVARLCQAIGMEVGVVSRFTPAGDLEARGIRPIADVDALCAWADVVSLHGVPGDQPAIGARQLAAIGPEGILINTARGALVDEFALAEALRDGVLGSAGLDVLSTEPPDPGHPVLMCPNLILTPHIGGSSVEALEETGMQVVTKVIDALRRIGLLAPV